MSLLDRVNIVRNLGEVREGDGHELLEQLPPEELPELLEEIGRRKVVAANQAMRRAGHAEGEDAFLPPPAMPPPSRGAAAAGGLPENEEEDEDLQLALALSRSEAQSRGSTPAATARPSPATTPQRHATPQRERQFQPRFAENSPHRQQRRQQQQQQEEQPRLSDQG